MANDDVQDAAKKITNREKFLIILAVIHIIIFLILVAVVIVLITGKVRCEDIIRKSTGK